MSKKAMKLAASVLKGSQEYKRGHTIFVEAVEELEEALVDQPAPVQQCMDHGECFGGKCIYPAPQPAQQQQQEARIAQLEAELMRMQGRELKLQFAMAEQPAQQQEPVTEFKSPGQRWADGDDHDSRSEALYKFIADTDFKHCRDSFCFKSGGDGDNGETLMFILDCWFAQQHTSPPAQSKPLTDEQQIAEALRVQGMTLVKTASGYEVLKLG